MEFVINGKVALITGGSSGMGYHFARELLKNGLKGVAILDIDEAKGHETQNTFREEFGKNSCIFIKTDVSKESQMEDAFRFTVQTFKHLDIVINNAGIISEVKWKKCLDINLRGCITGTMLAIDTFLPEYKSGSEGVIINISSVLGLEPWGVMPIYTASKQGIVAFSRAYGAKEHYARSKVRVLAVCPGQTLTPLSSPAPEKYNMAYMQHFSFTSDDFPSQEPVFVAESVMNIIKNGQNGSVWVVEGGQPAYEVAFLDRYGMCKNKL